MLLSIKLGKCESWSNRTLRRALADTLESYNRCRNAAVTAWYIDAVEKGHPDDKLRWDKTYYHHARRAARSLNSKLVATAAKECNEWLRGRIPWNDARRGRAPYRWKAILESVIALPTHSGCSFGIPVADFRIGWDGQWNRPAGKDRCTSKCVIRIPLFSKESGYRTLAPTVRLLVCDLSYGNRQILRRIVDQGDTLVCGDSRLSFKDGNWFLRLTYKDLAKPKEVVTLGDDDPVVELWPNRHQDNNPFLILLPDGRRRFAGFGKLYQQQTERLEQRRAVLQTLYRHELAGSGHGRGRYYAKVKPLTRGRNCLEDRIAKQVIADTVKAVRQSNAVGVVYREPTMPLRNWCWYGRRSLPWAWSEFELRLKAKLQNEGIGYVKVRLGCAEYRDRFTVQDMPDSDGATAD